MTSIYEQAMKQFPYDTMERKKLLQLTFNKYINAIPLYIKTDELNIRTDSMAYVFEHIKDKILELIGLFVPYEERTYILTKNWSDIKYRKKIFDILVNFENKAIMMWMFFHFNYFNSTNLDQQRKILMEYLLVLLIFNTQYMQWKR